MNNHYDSSIVEGLYQHKPCKNCPFRKQDGITCLGKNRAIQIVDDLEKDGFVCHETTGVTGNIPSHRRQCAGSMILSIKENKPSCFVKLYQGMFNKQPKLSNFDIIVESFEDFVKIQSL